MLPGLINDEKKVAALIVGSPETKEEPKEMLGLDAAAEEIISAVKSGDAKSLAAALHSFYQMCEMKEEQEEESEILEEE